MKRKKNIVFIGFVMAIIISLTGCIAEPKERIFNQDHCDEPDGVDHINISYVGEGDYCTFCNWGRNTVEFQQNDTESTKAKNCLNALIEEKDWDHYQVMIVREEDNFYGFINVYYAGYGSLQYLALDYIEESYYIKYTDGTWELSNPFYDAIVVACNEEDSVFYSEGSYYSYHLADGEITYLFEDPIKSIVQIEYTEAVFRFTEDTCEFCFEVNPMSGYGSYYDKRPFFYEFSMDGSEVEMLDTSVRDYRFSKQYMGFTSDTGYENCQLEIPELEEMIDLQDNEYYDMQLIQQDENAVGVINVYSYVDSLQTIVVYNLPKAVVRSYAITYEGNFCEVVTTFSDCYLVATNESDCIYLKDGAYYSYHYENQKETYLFDDPAFTTEDGGDSYGDIENNGVEVVFNFTDKNGNLYTYHYAMDGTVL